MMGLRLRQVSDKNYKHLAKMKTKSVNKLSFESLRLQNSVILRSLTALKLPARGRALVDFGQVAEAPKASEPKPDVEKDGGSLRRRRGLRQTSGNNSSNKSSHTLPMKHDFAPGSMADPYSKPSRSLSLCADTRQI